MTDAADKKIWAHSGDSHLIEPPGLFDDRLPADQAARMPRSVLDEDGKWETVHVDNQTFRRRMPSKRDFRDSEGNSLRDRAPGSNDMALRIKDLDQEGVWAELTFPSLGVWMSSIQDPDLLAAGCRAINDWAIEFQRFNARYVCTASIPLLTAETAVAEIHRAKELGYYAAFFPVGPPEGLRDFHYPLWEPVWAALAETDMVLAFHIGTDPHDATRHSGSYFSGPGGAILNYMETTFGGQRAVAKMIASGVFDRYENLKVIVSEGGATWGPFIADRLDEAYRQHGFAVSPTLRRLPSEYLYDHIYASFQHDRSAIAAMTAMGWQNICWGSDYPHLEGTFGHTQKTLHELFDDVDDETTHRITVGAFEELFPHVPKIPALA